MVNVFGDYTSGGVGGKRGPPGIVGPPGKRGKQGENISNTVKQNGI